MPIRVFILLALACVAGARPLSAQVPDEDLFTPETYVVERVEVRGNDSTLDMLILREVSLHPGELLDEDEVARSRLRIMSLGLFRDVRMRLTRGSERGHVVLVVEVDERPSLVISELFLGFTDVSPVYGGFGLADGNLLGTSLIGNAAFVVGADDRWAIRASVHDPAVLGRRFLAGVTGTFVRGVEVDCPSGLGACDRAQLDRLRYRRAGGIVSIGFPAGRSARVYLHYRAEALAAQIVPGSLRQSGAVVGDPELPALAEGTSALSTVAVGYEYDTTDDPFIATRGTRVFLSTEVSSPLFFSGHDYARHRASVVQYFPGPSDHSIRVAFFGGFVQGEAPFFDRYHVADFSYFTVGANTVPRALELSFTEVAQYDDVLVSTDLAYQVPAFSGGGFFYRGYFYLALKATLSARTVDRSLLDLSVDPKNEVSRFPLSGDLGLRVDTAVGVFSLGISYPLDQIF